MNILILLLASFIPSGQETIVYINELSMINSEVTVLYRINDLPQKRHTGQFGNNDTIVTLPETTVRIGWSWEWVFNEYEWVIACEPNTKIISTY